MYSPRRPDLLKALNKIMAVSYSASWSLASLDVYVKFNYDRLRIESIRVIFRRSELTTSIRTINAHSVRALVTLSARPLNRLADNFTAGLAQIAA